MINEDFIKWLEFHIEGRIDHDEEWRGYAAASNSWNAYLEQVRRDVKLYEEECAQIDAEAERALNEHEAEYGADGRIAQERGVRAW